MVTHISGQARTPFLSLALIALTLAAEPASARQWSAVCSNLSGVRVDDQVTEPAFTQDAEKGASWAYSWNTDTKKAILTLPASHASDGRSHKQEGVVSSHRGGFFTIVSSLPGAVWTHDIHRHGSALGDPEHHEEQCGPLGAHAGGNLRHGALRRELPQVRRHRKNVPRPREALGE
jgi:hypothetical protein